MEEENGVRPASGRGPGQPPPPASTARHTSGMPDAALSWKRNTMGDERGELINQGQKTASTSKPGETNEETKRKKGEIQNTNQTKNSSKTKHPKARRKITTTTTWNGCGAENRGLKGGGLWLPQGGAPHPWQNTGSGPPTQHPRASAATEVTSSQRKNLRGKPARPHRSPLDKGPLGPLLI